ncbi:hypothetical protein OIU92_22870 [Escherichia coli]|nr:hypothetical protein [Escherichia coli]
MYVAPIAHGYAVSINDEQAMKFTGRTGDFTGKMCLISHSLQLGMPGHLIENKRDTADRALLTRHVRHHGDAVAIVVARR